MDESAYKYHMPNLSAKSIPGASQPHAWGIAQGYSSRGLVGGKLFLPVLDRFQFDPPGLGFRALSVDEEDITASGQDVYLWQVYSFLTLIARTCTA
jgi:hypothetical protein